jgi:tRNA threonylcarbamoyladenosine biosynthesis protein TsaB
MLTLAVDTTAEFGSIALVSHVGQVGYPRPIGNRPAEAHPTAPEGADYQSAAGNQPAPREVLLHAPGGFSGPLFEQIQALLAREEVQLTDIDLFAGASGPGSFTGVRIGLAAIKGLAEVLGKPAVAVSNLEALAEFGEGDLRATIIDARRGEVFAALFDRDGTAPIPECVVRFQHFLEMVAERDCEFISTNFDPFRAALAGTRCERCPVITAPRALAATLGRIAMRRAALGAITDPASIEANYVRRSDAELLWKQPA